MLYERGGHVTDTFNFYPHSCHDLMVNQSKNKKIDLNVEVKQDCFRHKQVKKNYLLN